MALTSWVEVDEEPSTPVAVVWMGDLQTLDPGPLPLPSEPELDPPQDPEPAQAADIDPDQAPAIEPDPPAEAEPEEQLQARAAPAPVRQPETRPPSADEPPAEADAVPPAEADAVPPAEDAEEPARGFIVREADLEEAWRRAREQLEQEQNYLTFTLDDVIEEPAPEEPGPSESIFEAAERFGNRGGPSMLAPNRARTRVGRALAEFCNALTGGFGISLGGLNLGSVCADPQESAKLFAHLKPAYLRSRPVCTEVEPAGGVSADAAPVIKCRLVLEEEMDQLAVE